PSSRRSCRPSRCSTPSPGWRQSCPDRPPMETREMARHKIPPDVLEENPDAAAAFWRLYGILWSHGTVDEPTKEVARLRNARTTGCNYCKAVRFEGARNAGLT